MALIIPEVAPEPIKPAEVQAGGGVDAFGGGQTVKEVGKELDQVQTEMSQIAAFEKVRADHTAVEEAVGNKLSPTLTDSLHNPQTGALARIQQSSTMDDALKTQQDSLTEFKKQANEISGGLNGDNQKAAFAKQAISMADEFDRATMTAVNHKQRDLSNQAYRSFVKNTIFQAASLHGDPLRDGKLASIVDHTQQYGQMWGWDPEKTEEEINKNGSTYHSAIIDQMLREGKYDQAHAYYDKVKDGVQVNFGDTTKDLPGIADYKIRDQIEKNMDVVPKQQKEVDKKEKDEAYDNNMKQAMMDMFDGNMTLSEAQRRFRNDELKKSDYNILESKLSKPDANIIRTFEQSDPETFNKIREAQMNGTNSPGEIQRMVAEGAAAKKITPDDGKYLLKINSATPPTPRDKEIDANAKNIRDFAERYFAETNFIGNPKNEKETDDKVEGLVNSYYREVDKSKANGDKLAEIRDRIKKTAVQSRFPSLGSYEHMPDIAVDINGKISKLLNPDQKSQLKPRFRIIKNDQTNKT